MLFLVKASFLSTFHPPTGRLFYPAKNIKNTLDKYITNCYNTKAVRQQTEYGGIAQLGERLNGIQEVSGSIPLISTKDALSIRRKVPKSFDFGTFLFVLVPKSYAFFQAFET